MCSPTIFQSWCGHSKSSTSCFPAGALWWYGLSSSLIFENYHIYILYAIPSRVISRMRGGNAVGIWNEPHSIDRSKTIPIQSPLFKLTAKPILGLQRARSLSNCRGVFWDLLRTSLSCFVAIIPWQEIAQVKKPVTLAGRANCPKKVLVHQKARCLNHLSFSDCGEQTQQKKSTGGWKTCLWTTDQRALLPKSGSR